MSVRTAVPIVPLMQFVWIELMDTNVDADPDSLMPPPRFETFLPSFDLPPPTSGWQIPRKSVQSTSRSCLLRIQCRTCEFIFSWWMSESENVEHCSICHSLQTPQCRDGSSCAANEECKGGECRCVLGAQKEANGVCKGMPIIPDHYSESWEHHSWELPFWLACF